MYSLHYGWPLRKITIDKVLGFGSDGASVMMASRSGVGVRQKELTGCLTIHMQGYQQMLALSIPNAANTTGLEKSYKLVS